MSVTKWSETPPALSRLAKVCRRWYSGKYGTPARRSVALHAVLTVVMDGLLALALVLGTRYSVRRADSTCALPASRVSWFSLKWRIAVFGTLLGSADVRR